MHTRAHAHTLAHTLTYDLSQVVVVKDTIYAITNSNWLVSWNDDLETWVCTIL